MTMMKLIGMNVCFYLFRAIFYINKDTKLEVHSSGTGGMHECIKHLESDVVFFKFYKLYE